MEVFNDMVERIIKEGIITSGDPMRCTQPLALQQRPPQLKLDPLWKTTDIEEALPPFSIGFVKGKARASTALALFGWCMLNGINLRVEHPLLHASGLRIYIFHTPKGSRREESIENHTISCRGALRRAPDLVTVTYMCIDQIDSGDPNYADFIKLLNTKATKQHQITGTKATSVKFLIEHLRRDDLNLILDEVSTMGWKGSLFSEDNMSSRKWYPGFQHKTVVKVWGPRIKVNNGSVNLHLRRAIIIHNKLPLHFRKKQERQEFDAQSERACALWHVGQEFIQEVLLLLYVVLCSFCCSGMRLLSSPNALVLNITHKSRAVVVIH